MTKKWTAEEVKKILGKGGLGAVDAAFMAIQVKKKKEEEE
tara:strand:+ start:908 stop:1027 length:120 start_codon:yes stop_codon:yes gene_type:complete